MRHQLFTVITLLMLALLSEQGFAASVVRIAYPDQENAPRATGNGVEVPAELPGISVELMQMVGDALQLDIRFLRAPWQRCQYLLERGSVDAIFHASYKPDRAQFGVYPQKDGKLDTQRSIYVNRYVVYTRATSDVGWDGERFLNAPRPLGAMLGAAVVSDLHRISDKVEEENQVRVNFDKLQAGHLSAYVELETIGDSFLNAHAGTYGGIVKLPISFSTQVYYLLISKPFYAAHPDLAEAIFDAIRDLKQQDRYLEMLRMY